MRCKFRKCKIEGEPCRIRNKIVCNRCFYIIKKDNVRRQRRGEDIPKSFKLLPVTIKEFKTELKGGI